MNAMYQHFPSIGTHLVYEIQRSLDHLPLNGNSKWQIEQAKHQAIFPLRHQVIRMAFGHAPYPVSYRHAMEGAAGMNNSPTILS